MLTEILWTIVGLVAFYVFICSAFRLKRIAADVQAIAGMTRRDFAERSADRDLRRSLNIVADQDGVHWAVSIDDGTATENGD